MTLVEVTEIVRAADESPNKFTNIHFGIRFITAFCKDFKNI